jgi:hypothetical protein
VGSHYEFTCAGCGYTAEVSGGRDVGMFAVVRTMTCSQCKILVDVLIGRAGKDGPTGDPVFDKDLNLCPECKSSAVRPWSNRRFCPRCRKKMTKDLKSEIDWD